MNVRLHLTLRVHSFCLSLLAVLILCCPSEGNADQSVLSCDMTYSGIITDDRVEAFLANNSSDGELRAGSVLCLDSPGGSYGAALQLYRAITQNSTAIATYVPPGNDCLSACSFVFLSGNTWVGQGATKQFNARILNLGSRLGFHAPFTNFDANMQLTGKDGNQIFQLAVETLAASNSMRLETRSDGPMINDFLFSGYINTPPSKFFEILTISDAILADIEVRGAPKVKNVDEDAVFQVCDLAVTKYVTENWYPNLLATAQNGAALVEVIRSAREKFIQDNLEMFDNYSTASQSLMARSINEQKMSWAVQGFPSPSHHNQGLVCLLTANPDIRYLDTWYHKDLLTVKNFKIELFDLSRNEDLGSPFNPEQFRARASPWKVFQSELPYYSALKPDFSLVR